MGSDWLFVVKIRVRNMWDHEDKPTDSEVRQLIDEEGGFIGLTDWPDDYEIVSAEPITD